MLQVFLDVKYKGSTIFLSSNWDMQYFAKYSSVIDIDAIQLRRFDEGYSNKKKHCHRMSSKQLFSLCVRDDKYH